MRWWFYSAGSFGWSRSKLVLVAMLFRRYDPGPLGIGLAGIFALLTVLSMRRYPLKG